LIIILKLPELNKTQGGNYCGCVAHNYKDPNIKACLIYFTDI